MNRYDFELTETGEVAPFQDDNGPWIYIQDALNAIKAEEELCGPMPDHVWDHIKNLNREGMMHFLRESIRVTKQNISRRINGS